MTDQRMLRGITLAAIFFLTPTAKANDSFSVDANILIAECLSKSDFCLGFITGSVQTGQTTGVICKFNENVNLDEVVKEALLSMELYYEYRSRPAEGFIINTTKAKFCE